MEPKDLWQRELPESLRERGPKVVTEKVKLEFTGGHYGFTRDAPDGQWCDLWVFDDLVVPTGLLHAPAGMPRDEQRNVPATYDDFRAGTWDKAERLADMTTNHVEAAINYPNVFPRFAGQGFLERDDKDLALACLRIYNDWMIDEWCGGDAKGRLIPLTLVPLWDPELAAEEVRRCVAKGSYAIAFTENPAKLGLPSMYTGDWDVLWSTCAETDTTVSMHIGSSSSMPTTSAGRPAGHLDVAVRPERPGLPGRLGLLRHPRAPPGPQDRLRREPGRLDAVPARAHGRGVGRRPGRRRRTGPAQRAGEGSGLRLRVRRPRRPEGPARRRPRARSCSRPTSRTPTGPSRTPARWPTASSPPRAWTRTSATPSCGATPSRPTASSASASPSRAAARLSPTPGRLRSQPARGAP